MKVRPVRHPDDLDDLRRLFEQCRIADGHAPIGEHKYVDLMAGTSEGSMGRVFFVEDQLIAYVHLGRRRKDSGWVLETAIQPGYRRPGFIRSVLQSAIDLVADKDGGTIRVWVYHPAVAETVKDLGFHEERQLLQMRLPLPPRQTATVPAGMRLAPFRVGRDEERWIEVNNRAFAGHPENGGWTPEILADRIRREWFDADGFLMAWQGSNLAGFCWTKVHPGALGEIYVIAVDPDFQGRSLGPWLTLEGLWNLYRRRQATTAMLYVDAANGPAVGMYERLGFELDHVDGSFVRAL
ncbi:MAG TPA: mycothiol synthase [Acidimicrobiia bacterium]|nr:mycothiol synthase [Acidimicrobiia bacterium]